MKTWMQFWPSLAGLFLAVCGLALTAAEPKPTFAAPPTDAAESSEAQAASNDSGRKPDSGKTRSDKAGKSEKKQESSFVRLQRGDKDEPKTLETAITNYRKAGTPDAAQVDLVGAIHVGDKSYYEKLNQVFKDYDAVLYELVAPEEANVPQPGATPGSAVGGIQVGMTAMLDLAFQLDHIDYKAKNMVHADMSPEEFDASMKKRNESFVGMFARLMGRSFAEQAKNPVRSNDFAILAAMFAEDRAFQLKCIMAEEMAANDEMMDSLSGPKGSTILTERNKKALEVLKRELAAGKKKIAIFYGAAHMADFEKRLAEEFGLARGETTWLIAWSLERPKAKERPARKKPAAKPAE